MKTIQVHASKHYPVHIGSGLFGHIGSYIKGQKVCIISDSNVWPIYGSRLQSCLEKDGFPVVSFVIRAGENSKNSVFFLEILNLLAENRFQRSDTVLALGGGVVGDLAGFCAACYLRGIPYIQVPTSLLAMVDSSVGGKTAIDLPAGKNLAGAFYQPEAVLCDTDCLGTLPDQIFRQGCSEVIKYGILYEECLFAQLEAQGLQFDREAVITRCIARKAQVVEADELDTGERRKLNLGHTLGHALEKESDYSLSHGEAVAIGIAIVTRAAANLGYCNADSCARIVKVLEQFGLPTHTTLAAEALLHHTLGDKKAAGKSVHMIVPEAIGKCQIHPMDENQLLYFIKAGL